MFEIVDGRTPEHGYTISSPCEPKGSGELKCDEILLSIPKDFLKNVRQRYKIANMVCLRCRCWVH